MIERQMEKQGDEQERRHRANRSIMTKEEQRKKTTKTERRDGTRVTLGRCLRCCLPQDFPPATLPPLLRLTTSLS